jgi:hypothetical protein
MLTFFTDPYPDELIYSAIARYHYYIGNLDYKDTIEELFGKRTIIPNLYIGSNFNSLVEQLGSKYNIDSIINNHTIFPFYSPFMPLQRKHEILKDIKYNGGGAVYTKIGIVAGGTCKKESICYCLECAKNDIERYGEAYIHREHQLQGVLVCPHHSAYLHSYKLNRKNTSRLSFIKLDEKYLHDNKIEVENNILVDKLSIISKLAYRLLTYDTSAIDREMVFKRYKNLLYERGLTSINGSVKQQNLYEEFVSFYGKDILALLGSSIDNNNEYNWLRVITRNLKRTVHPIRHILFINYLIGDIDVFFSEIREKYNPFGIGPWPCLNKISKHYKKDLIAELKIATDSKTRLPVGTFSCSCGFAYSRKGPDKCIEDRYRIGRIKSFGYEWEEKLKKTLEEGGLSLREVSRIMNCDSKTVINYDRILGINHFKDRLIKIESKEETPANHEFKEIESYKENILRSIIDNPRATRTEIRELCNKEYTYLYRHDKEWLTNNLPHKREISTNSNNIVDWESRDIETLMLLQEKYKEFLQKEKPIRITKSMIGRSLGILANLENNIHKLPETELYLSRIVESVEDFQIRRCKHIISQKLLDNSNIKLWEIQRIAGIKTKDFQKIKNQIEDYTNLKRGLFKYEQ